MQENNAALDKKRLWIYLAFAFGIAWVWSLVVYLTGGLVNSRILVPQLNITLATAILALGVMFAPALANLFTRLITREGKQNLFLLPGRNVHAGRYWLLAWILPAVGTILGAVFFFLVFPDSFDSQLSNLQALLRQQGTANVSQALASTVLLIQLGQAILISPILNGFFTFGEEFGWRAYLLPKLLPLGARKAVLLSGLIWGVWHWPIIAMGHNYGLDYQGFPWSGMLAMTWFTFILGTVLSWLTLKEGSVWPAVIGHAGINGVAAIGLLAVKTGKANLLIGPTPVGIIGGIAFSLLAVVLFAHPKAFTPGKEIERWKSEPISPEPPL